MPRNIHEEHLSMISAELLEKTTVKMADVATHLRLIMDEYGFAVVTEVLLPEEVQYAERLFDGDLETIVDLAPEAKAAAFDALVPRVVDEGATATLAKKWPEKAPIGRRTPSFASDFGIPQGRAAWFCRQHENVAKVFFTMHRDGNEGVKSPADLCVGMDNVFFCNEPEDHETPEESVKDVMWPHADQSTHAPGGERDCFQSILYVWPSNARRSTTVVWPGSHLDEFNETMKVCCEPHHYVSLPDERLPEFVRRAVRVPIPSGALILWNSKLFHQGWNEGPRLAFPICMEPRSRRNEEALKSKRYACERGYPTTHWASLGIWHGASSLVPGGTRKFPLKTLAHKWMWTENTVSKGNDDEEGILDSSVAALL